MNSRHLRKLLCALNMTASLKIWGERWAGLRWVQHLELRKIRTNTDSHTLASKRLSLLAENWKHAEWISMSLILVQKTAHLFLHIYNKENILILLELLTSFMLNTIISINQNLHSDLKTDILHSLQLLCYIEVIIYVE